jgi:hypothetical protein
MANLTPKTAFGKTIRIDQQDYTFVPHTTALPMAYAQSGGKGTVYQLKGRDGQYWALKVFHPQFRHPRITTINGALKENYESIPSVTIWKRWTIRRPKYNALLEEYPDLEYAVLMPWVEGDNWENYWSDEDQGQPLDATKSLRLALELGKTLSQMEQAAIAHCDLAGSNIMVDPARLRVELIDIEDSFIHGIEPPATGSIPLGTSGYQHAASRKLNHGLWCAEGDRFAGGVLLAELLTWHVPEIRAAADGAKHYFQDADLEVPSPSNSRFKLMVDVLKTGSTEAADLFTRAWTASRLADCPSLGAWQAALAKARPTDASVFTMLDAPVMNTVEYPSEDKSAGPLFSWSGVKGAKDYILEITTIRNSRESGHPRTIGCSDNRYVSRANADGVFQARVKARSDRRESAWSKPVVFGRLQAPTLSKNVSANEIRLSWSTIPNASHYIISIIGNAIPQEDREVQTTECKIDLSAYPPGIYTVLVRASGIVAGFQGRLVGYASNNITISVPARKPEGLSISKTGFAAKVTWQPVEYAAAYRVLCQPLGKSGFDTLTQEVQSAHAEFRLPPGAYEIQVTALTEDGIPSVPATRRETIGGLKVPRATLTEERKKHLVQWDSIDFAEKYRLEFMRDGKSVKSAETVHCNYTIGSDWEPGTYQVRVQALTRIDGFSEAVFSEPSLPVEVSIRPPRPTWERSKVRVDENNVTLGWNKLLRVTHYRVHYRNTDSNQSECTETNDTKIRLTLPPGTYDFWIVAHYGDITSEESRVETLILKTPVPAPTWVSTSAEENMIQLEWSPIELATGYKIEFRGAIPTNIVDWDDTHLDASFPPGTYSIRVAACVGELQSPWSEEASVRTGLASPKILGPHQIEPGQDYTVEWTEVPFAQSYQIYDYGYVHPQNGKVPDEPRNKWVSSTTSRTLMRQRHPGRMAFRVAAFWRSASGEEHTSISEIHVVSVGIVALPLLIRIAELGTIGEPIQVSWQPYPDIVQYEVEWAYNEEFSDAASTFCDGVRTALTFEHAGIVFVRVRPRQQTPNGTWSKTSQLVIQPNSPKTFTVGISGNGSWVQWDVVPSASSYRIEWSNELPFAEQEHQTSETRETSAVIPSPGLFARIKALTADLGIESEWSETVVLPPYENGNLQTIFLSEDYRCSSGDPITIEWRCVGEGIEITNPHFEVQIADTEGFENPVSHATFGFSFNLTLEETGTRFARVRFIRDTYRYAWSRVCRIQAKAAESQVIQNAADEQAAPFKPRLGGFLKNLLNKPKELQRPVLKMVTSTDLIILRWSAVSTASHYEIQVTVPSGKTHTKKRPAVEGTEMRLPKAKLALGAYSCQVIAIDENAELKSEPSNVITFQAK